MSQFRFDVRAASWSFSIVHHNRKFCKKKFKANSINGIHSQTCGLVSKLQSNGRKSLDDFANSGYAGRAVMQ